MSNSSTSMSDNHIGGFEADGSAVDQSFAAKVASENGSAPSTLPLAEEADADVDSTQELEATEPPAPMLLLITSRQFNGGYIDSIVSDEPDENGIVPRAEAVVLGNRNPNLRTRRNVFISIAPKPKYLVIRAFSEKVPTAMAGRDSSAVSFLVNFLIHNRLATTAESQFLTRLYELTETTDASGFLGEEERSEDAWVRCLELSGDGYHVTALLEVFAPELTPEQIAAHLRNRLEGTLATVEVITEEPEDSQTPDL